MGIHAILEKAVELRDLSREGIANAFENRKSVDTGGLRKALSYGATCQEKVGVTGSTIWKIDTTQPIALATVADVDSKLEERSRPGQTRATTRPSARPTARPTARPS